ncbi:MAG TPA: DUF2934 domain-containing protein [Azospirillaceae bacterium]|nr:DUF2934 domain-containing protein [Azospirillaceae bacterium]
MVKPDLEERIRCRAFALWVAEGRPDGRAADHWAEAERAVLAEEAGVRHGGEPNLSAVAEGMRENAIGPVSPDAGSRGRVARARRKDATGPGQGEVA